MKYSDADIVGSMASVRRTERRFSFSLGQDGNLPAVIP